MSSIETKGGPEAYMAGLKDTLTKRHGDGVEKLTLPEQEELSRLDKVYENEGHVRMTTDPKLKEPYERRMKLVEKMLPTEEDEEPK